MDNPGEFSLLCILKKFWEELVGLDSAEEAIRSAISATADATEQAVISAESAKVPSDSPTSPVEVTRDILSLTAIFIASQGMRVNEERQRAAEEELTLRQMHRLLLKQNRELRERAMSASGFSPLKRDS